MSLDIRVVRQGSGGENGCAKEWKPKSMLNLVSYSVVLCGWSIYWWVGWGENQEIKLKW